MAQRLKSPALYVRYFLRCASGNMLQLYQRLERWIVCKRAAALDEHDFACL